MWKANDNIAHSNRGYPTLIYAIPRRASFPLSFLGPFMQSNYLLMLTHVSVILAGVVSATDYTHCLEIMVSDLWWRSSLLHAQGRINIIHLHGSHGTKERTSWPEFGLEFSLLPLRGECPAHYIIDASWCNQSTHGYLYMWNVTCGSEYTSLSSSWLSFCRDGDSISSFIVNLSVSAKAGLLLCVCVTLANRFSTVLV